MIYLNTPICPRKELYADYLNKFVNLVGNEDWVLVFDHDALFTTSHWFEQVRSAASEGNALITCSMNDGGVAPQRIKFQSDKLSEHFKKGEELYKEHGNKTEEIKGVYCGTFMLFPKLIWEDVGGFKSGFGGVDYDFFTKVGKRYPIKILKGLYVYHRRVTHS